MSNPKIELVTEQLTICRDETLRVASDVPEGSRFKQLKEGKAHPAWLVGHLTNTVDTLVLYWMLGEAPRLSKEFKKQFAPDFAGGLPIVADPGRYPAWDEIIGLYRQVLTAGIEKVGHMQDSELPEPLKGDLPEQLRQHFSSNGRTLNIMVLHDSYHRGQMGLLSKLGS